MSDVESLKKQAKTVEQIRIIYSEVLEPKEPTWIHIDVVLPLLEETEKSRQYQLDLGKKQQKYVLELEEQLDICKKMYTQEEKDSDTLFAKYKGLEEKLSAIQKHLEKAPKDVISYSWDGWFKELAVLLKEVEATK